MSSGVVRVVARKVTQPPVISQNRRPPSDTSADQVTLGGGAVTFAGLPVTFVKTQ